MAKDLKATPDVSIRTLARRENISPTTALRWLKLLGLCSSIQKRLLKIDDRATAWRFSVRRLLPLVSLESSQQEEMFRRLEATRRTFCKRVGAAPSQSSHRPFRKAS